MSCFKRGRDHSAADNSTQQARSRHSELASDAERRRPVVASGWLCPLRPGRTRRRRAHLAQPPQPTNSSTRMHARASRCAHRTAMAAQAPLQRAPRGRCGSAFPITGPSLVVRLDARVLHGGLAGAPALLRRAHVRRSAGAPAAGEEAAGAHGRGHCLCRAHAPAGSAPVPHVQLDGSQDAGRGASRRLRRGGCQRSGSAAERASSRCLRSRGASHQHSARGGMFRRVLSSALPSPGGPGTGLAPPDPRGAIASCSPPGRLGRRLH